MPPIGEYGSTIVGEEGRGEWQWGELGLGYPGTFFHFKRCISVDRVGFIGYYSISACSNPVDISHSVNNCRAWWHSSNELKPLLITPYTIVFYYNWSPVLHRLCINRDSVASAWYEYTVD